MDRYPRHNLEVVPGLGAEQGQLQGVVDLGAVGMHGLAVVTQQVICRYDSERHSAQEKIGGFQYDWLNKAVREDLLHQLDGLRHGRPVSAEQKLLRTILGRSARGDTYRAYFEEGLDTTAREAFEDKITATWRHRLPADGHMGGALQYIHTALQRERTTLLAMGYSEHEASTEAATAVNVMLNVQPDLVFTQSSSANER